MSKTINKSLVSKILGWMLKPAVVFGLKNRVKIQGFIEVLKAVYVEQSEAEIIELGDVLSNSKLIAMTGLHRKEVTRIRESGPSDKFEASVLTKVIGQWEHDERFSHKPGRPRALSCGGKSSEFAELVLSISSVLNTYSILYELERAGYVKKTENVVELVKEIYMPKEDVEEIFWIASQDMNDLLQAVNENIFEEEETANLHLRTEFDNIDPEAEEKIRNWLLDEGSLFHEKARKFISAYDADVNPDLSFSGKGIRAVLGTFSFSDKPLIEKASVSTVAERENEETDVK